jgi:glycosyltransferase involved in cell wall biosynthesis
LTVLPSDHLSLPEKIRVLFLFNIGRIARLGDDTPAEFFYGFHDLCRDHIEARFVEPHPPTQGLVLNDGTIFPLAAPLTRATRLLKRTRLTFLTRLLQLAFAGRKLIREADIIIAVTAPWIYATGALSRLGILRAAVIGIAIGPFRPNVNAKQYLINLGKRWLYADAHLVFLGDADRTTFLEYVSAHPRRADVLYFGIDSDFWRPVEGDAENYVFSIGNAGRDFSTLLAAWYNRPGLLKIVTNLLDPEHDARPDVEISRGVWHGSVLSDAQVRALYQRARYVVTPLYESSQPCGQSATLQAMACGKAVIITRTEGLWDPLRLQHLENCYLVRPGDTEDLRAGLEYLDTHPDEVARLGRNARATVEKYYTAKGFARDLEHLIKIMTNK